MSMCAHVLVYRINVIWLTIIQLIIYNFVQCEIKAEIITSIFATSSCRQEYINTYRNGGTK